MINEDNWKWKLIDTVRGRCTSYAFSCLLPDPSIFSGDRNNDPAETKIHARRPVTATLAGSILSVSFPLRRRRTADSKRTAPWTTNTSKFLNRFGGVRSRQVRKMFPKAKESISVVVSALSGETRCRASDDTDGVTFA